MAGDGEQVPDEAANAEPSEGWLVCSKCRTSPNQQMMGQLAQQAQHCLSREAVLAASAHRQAVFIGVKLRFDAPAAIVIVVDLREQMVGFGRLNLDWPMG